MPTAPTAASSPQGVSLRGLTLKPIKGWEGCAATITVPRGTLRAIGRAELNRRGVVGVSKTHCTLDARASKLVLTATASFEVIVVHTWNEDKTVETFRRLSSGAAAKADLCVVSTNSRQHDEVNRGRYR